VAMGFINKAVMSVYGMRESNFLLLAGTYVLATRQAQFEPSFLELNGILLTGEHYQSVS